MCNKHDTNVKFGTETAVHLNKKLTRKFHKIADKANRYESTESKNFIDIKTYK